MMKEMDKEITGILLEYDDGSTKRIEKGCCVDLDSAEDKLKVDLLDAKPTDIVRLAYGLVYTVERLGMMDLLHAMVAGEEVEEE